MQDQDIPVPTSESITTADVAAEHTPDQPPVEIQLELAIALIATQRDLLASRDREIRVLHAMLKAAADKMVPAGTVWQ